MYTLKVSAHWRSAHWVRNFVWNFRTLKNKYDLTLCQSSLHTASETFVLQFFFGSGSIFCIFASVACILIGKDEEYEKTEKRMRKFQTQCAMAFTLKQPLMSIMDQIDPPWQTANIVLFNAFETLCFPQCITDTSQVNFSSVNVRKPCKYIHFAVRSGRGLCEWTSAAACMRTTQTEQNRIIAQEFWIKYSFC